MAARHPTGDRMRRVLLLLVLPAVALSCSSPRVALTGTAFKPRKATIQEVLKNSVRIQLREGADLRRSATGVVIDVVDQGGQPVSYVATNEHVVDARELPNVSYEVLVDDKKGTKTFKATVLAEGEVPGMDLAVLAVPGVKLEKATLASDDEPEVGDEVVVVGAPYGRGISVSGGMLSQVEWKDGVPTMLKTDAPVGYGASGGGIFSAQTGHLLGIIEGYRTAQVQVPSDTKAGGFSFDVPMPGETFGAPVAKLRRFAMERKLPDALSSALASRP